MLKNINIEKNDYICSVIKHIKINLKIEIYGKELVHNQGIK